MAIYFDMTICAGRSPKNALHLKAHFADMDCIMHDHCKLEEIDEDGVYWINIVPKGFGFGVPGDDSGQITSSAKRLSIIKSIYHKLQQISRFEFAVMGWDAGDFVHQLNDNVMEINGIRINSDLLNSPGVVLLKKHWEQIDEPANFTPFSATHVWTGGLEELAKRG